MYKRDSENVSNEHGVKTSLPLAINTIPTHTGNLSSYTAESCRYAADRDCQHSSLHFCLRVSGFTLEALPNRVPPGQNEDEMDMDGALGSL